MIGLAASGVTSILLVIQAAATSVAGTVRDGATGEVLSGALVSLTDVDQTAVTDAQGAYRLDRLPAGSHRLLVRRIGYAPRRLDVLVPPEGTVEITIDLGRDPVRLAAVNVGTSSGREDRAAGDELQAPDRYLPITAVREHPLLAEPDVLQALSGGAVAMRPESPSGIHVRGGGSDQIAYLLDGIPVFSPYHVAGAFSSWNPDALSGVELETASETWDALSGVVAATTRTPGTRHRAQAGLSNTQMRVTGDGPLGSGGAGYLWSLRTGFPGFPVPTREASYIRGEAGDRLAKLEAPLAAGRVRLLGYESASEFDAAATASSRNVFGWRSHSIGGEWTRASRTGIQSVRVWIAGEDADALWFTSDSTRDRLASRRRDAGLSVSVARAGSGGRSSAGLRLQESRTAYRLAPDASPGGFVAFETQGPLGAVFVERRQSIDRTVELVTGVAGTASAGEFRLSPRAGLYWRPAGGLVLSAGYARLHQFAQSLRNPESVVGMVFPVDLHVGAARSGVPIARTDQGIVAIAYHPRSSLRVRGEAYLRGFRDLVLVALQTAEPFATGAVTVGSGRAHGFAIEVESGGPRYVFVVSYGQQRVRFAHDDTPYTPDHAATHTVEAGVTVRPTATLSFRLSASGRFGRRTTSLRNPFEWEACNLSDRGCEFVGSPRANSDSLGATRLPGYARVDLGVRKHWQVRMAGRDAQLAVFGTLTNILAHRNALTMAPDPATGNRTAITMRPRAPLVLGIDWSF